MEDSPLTQLLSESEQECLFNPLILTGLVSLTVLRCALRQLLQPLILMQEMLFTTPDPPEAMTPLWSLIFFKDPLWLELMLTTGSITILHSLQQSPKKHFSVPAPTVLVQSTMLFFWSVTRQAPGWSRTVGEPDGVTEDMSGSQEAQAEAVELDIIGEL